MDLHYYSMEHSQLCHLSLSPTSNESGYWCVGDYNCFGRDQIESTEEQPVIRVVRRRNTANKKERRRTQSINNAFAELRECIPNVPPDTKLSKIKTLRLATSYICYLMSVLENEDYGEGFKADLGPQHRKITHQALQIYSEEENGRKLKGRTGWPQHVWALELKQENTL